LVYFVVIWYIFPHFGILKPRKIWQPWFPCRQGTGNPLCT
jgi:hypothetical protein